jgi:YggT family protein
MIHVIFELIRAVLGLLIIVLVVHAVLSWLIAFDVVSRTNAFVNTVWEFTSRVTYPMVKPIRRFIPPIAGVDLSILVLLLLLSLLQGPFSYWLEGALVGRPPYY